MRLWPDGRLAYPEQLAMLIKKSGKTTAAGWLALFYAVVLGAPWSEVFCVANDLDQAQGRVFEACRRMVEASPLLRGSARQ